MGVGWELIVNVHIFGSSFNIDPYGKYALFRVPGLMKHPRYKFPLVSQCGSYSEEVIIANRALLQIEGRYPSRLLVLRAEEADMRMRSFVVTIQLLEVAWPLELLEPAQILGKAADRPWVFLPTEHGFIGRKRPICE